MPDCARYALCTCAGSSSTVLPSVCVCVNLPAALRQCGGQNVGRLWRRPQRRTERDSVWTVMRQDSVTAEGARRSIRLDLNIALERRGCLAPPTTTHQRPRGCVGAAAQSLNLIVGEFSRHPQPRLT